MDLITPSFPARVGWNFPSQHRFRLLSFLLRDSLLFLLRLSPFRLTALKRNAQELKAAIVPYSRPAGPSSAGTIVNWACDQRCRRQFLRLHRLNPLPVQMAGTGRSKRNTSGVAPTPATDTRRYKKIGQVPGRTPEEKLDYLLKQKGYQRVSQPQASRDGMLRLPPSDGTNPFANVFGGRSIGN